MKIDGSFNTKGTVIGDNTIMTPSFVTADWVNTFLSGDLDTADKKLLGYYLRVPEANAIINYRAQVFASMIVRMRNIKTQKEVEQHNVLNLLKNPNPIQNFAEFAQQSSILKDIFGNGYMHPVFSKDATMTKTLWNLPSMDTEIIPQDDKVILFNKTKVEEVIKEYQFEYFSGQIKYPPEEIIHFNETQVRTDKDASDYLKGTSKLNALTQACENILTAYEARGILQGNSPMGIIVNQTKDSDGTIPMIPDDKDEIQKSLNQKYGLTRKKWQYLVTNASLDFVSMAVDISKLKLFEEVEDDQGAIADSYSFPIELFKPNATHANKQQAKKQLYQDATIPEATNWLEMMSKGLGLLDIGLELYPDFSHIQVLQDDLVSRTTMWQKASLALKHPFDTGVISKDEYRLNLAKVGIELKP